MRDEVERYCSLIEGSDSFKRNEFAAALAESLAGMLAAAQHLPAVSPTANELEHRPSPEEARGRFAAVERVLGEWAHYWTTVATHGDDAEVPVMLTLGDDLADIWLDLKPGLAGLQAGAPVGDVIWDWRFTFYTHWGRHATEALRALHARLADDGGPTQDAAEH